MFFSYKHFGDGLEAYSRTTRDDGKWVTVQVRKWRFKNSVIDIFDEKGSLIASARWQNCQGELVISSQDKQAGEDIIIQGALKAVTGKDYSIVVADEN